MDLWEWCGVFWSPKANWSVKTPSEEQRSQSVHPAGVPAPEPGSEMGNTGEHLVAFTQKPTQTDV